jgi:hypothetical protein
MQNILFSICCVIHIFSWNELETVFLDPIAQKRKGLVTYLNVNIIFFSCKFLMQLKVILVSLLGLINSSCIKDLFNQK